MALPAAPWGAQGLCRHRQEQTPGPAGISQAPQSGPCTFLGTPAAFWCSPATSLCLSVLPCWPFCAFRGPTEPSCAFQSHPLPKDFFVLDFWDLLVHSEDSMLRQPWHACSASLLTFLCLSWHPRPLLVSFGVTLGALHTSLAFPVASVCLSGCSRTLLAPLSVPSVLRA